MALFWINISYNMEWPAWQVQNNSQFTKNYGIWKEEKLFQEDHLSIQLEQPVSSLKIKEFKEKSHILDVLEMMKKDKL